MTENLNRIGYIPRETRWTATIVYQVTETETRTVRHHVMELHELHDLVERGPTFTAIRLFDIQYHGSKETIEESMQA